MRIFLALLVLCIGLSYATAEEPKPALDLMPAPASVQPGAGKLLIPQSFSVGIAGYNEPRIESAVRRFLSDLSKQTGMMMSTRAADPSKATLVLHADRASLPV